MIEIEGSYMYLSMYMVYTHVCNICINQPTEKLIIVTKLRS